MQINSYELMGHNTKSLGIEYIQSVKHTHHTLGVNHCTPLDTIEELFGVVLGGLN